MTVAVRYYSKTGNIKKIADAIAKGAGVEAKAIPDNGLKDPIDVLFLGGALYAGKIDNALRDYINQLSPDNIKKVVLFTSSVGNKTPETEMRNLLAERNIETASQAYYAKGKFLFVQRDRPNQEDLKNAEDFARSAIS